MLPSLGALSLHEATQPLSTAGNKDSAVKKDSAVVWMDGSDEEDEGDKPDEPTKSDAVALRNAPPGFLPSHAGRSGRGRDGISRSRGRGRGRGTNPTAPVPPKAKKQFKGYSKETPGKRMPDEAERQRMRQQMTKLSDLAGDDGPLTIIMAFLAKRLAPDEDALLDSDMKELCKGVYGACDELSTLNLMGKGGPDPKYDCNDPKSPIWQAAMVIYGIDPDYDNRWQRDGELITGRLYPHWNEIRILTEEDKLPKEDKMINILVSFDRSWVDSKVRSNAPKTERELFMNACRAFGGPIHFYHGKTLFGGAPAPIPQRKELWKQLVGSRRFLQSALSSDDEDQETRIKEWKHALRRPIKCVPYGDVAMAVLTDALKWRLRHLPTAAGIVARALKYNRKSESESEGDFKKVQTRMYALLWVISKLWEQCLPVFDTLRLAHRDALYTVLAELCAKSESRATDMFALFGTLQERNIDVFLLYEASGEPMDVRRDAWERLRELVEEGRITMTADSPWDYTPNRIRVA